MMLGLCLSSGKFKLHPASPCLMDRCAERRKTFNASHMHVNRFIIRVMTRKEIDIAIDWAAAEGWNPGLYDAECFYSADPSGFLIGLLDDEPVATISAVKYSEKFGFLGFYIVRPGYRGRGYGLQIWDAGMDYLHGCTIGLDGVVDQQENYGKSGFKLAYRNIRYHGTGGGKFNDYPGIVPLSAVPFDDLCKYDYPFFPANRSTFLRCWINQPQSTALGVRQNGKLAGYGVIRTCRTGYKIGPLFADTPVLAEHLLAALKANTPEGSPVFLDIPAVNTAAIALVDRHKMSPSFETARMYTGESPDLPINRLFGVTSFELG
jgi:GNAT superfamily N-acetyltransferase